MRILMELRAFGDRPYPNNLVGEKEWISKMFPSGLLTSILRVVKELETKELIGYVGTTKIDYIFYHSYE
jgi:hypothetical protein